MRPLQSFLLLCGLFSLCSAVFDDEAFLVDWEILNIGQLHVGNVVSPKKDMFNLVSDRNVLAGVHHGKFKWRVPFKDVKEGAPLRIATYSADEVITGVNYADGHCVIQVWDSYQGFLVDTLAEFDSEFQEVAALSDGSVIVALSNGDIHKIDISGEIVFSGKIGVSSQVKISVLGNGNVIILFNEKDTSNAHVAFFNGEELREHVLPTTFDSIKDFYGSKIVFEAQKHYLITVNTYTGQLSEVKALPDFDLYLPIQTDEYIAFERDHHIEVYTIDIEPHFTAENVFKYSLQYVDSTFVLYTEYRVNILDADTGAELQSYLSEEKIEHDNILHFYSSTDGIEEVYTLVQYHNNTYSFYINNQQEWTIDASLANITTHCVIDFSLDDTITTDEILYEEGLDIISAFIYRMKRHTQELRDFYNWCWLRFEQWATGELPDSNKTNDQYFGFEKLLITANIYGEIIALNTLDGAQVWAFNTYEKIIGLETAGDKKVFVFTDSGARYVLDAHTGKELTVHAITAPSSITKLSEEEDFLVEIQGGFDVLLSESPEKFHNTHYVKHTKHSVQGYQIINKKSHKTWRFDTSQDETIVGYVAKDFNEEIASIGVILGDRRVLYKYLYPNLGAIGVLNNVTKTLYIHIIDTITGEVLHSVQHDELVHADEKFNIVFGEHWVVYSYWSNLPTPDQKIVVIDLYESLVPNHRLSNSKSNQSSFNARFPPAVLSKSFILPHKVNALAISRTKFGVTTKTIIAALENGQIVSLPKPFLNARRVQGRDLTNDEKLEFMLLPYDPVISVDETNVISHDRSVFVNKLVTFPTTLESTSIVCAYGLDVFCTRVSPSLQFDKLTQSFDYVKLLGSLALLVSAYAVMRYFNSSKALKNSWLYDK